MGTREIPIADWPTFLDQFSRSHHGQPVEARMARSGSGEHVIVRELPLLGITIEKRVRGDWEIEIMAGEAGGEVFCHTLVCPLRVEAREWNDGVSAELKIQAQNGGTTWVRVGPQQQTLPPNFITDGYF